jgi:fatty-acyl-CoA synthase
MQGLMMKRELLLSEFLERANKLYPKREIVTRMPAFGGGIHRYTYAEATERTKRLANALTGLGVKGGDRVGTFAWNHHRHFEAYFAIPGIGAICHTLNIRLFPDQLIYIANHAADKVVLIDECLLDGWLAFADQLTTIETYVLMGDAERSTEESRRKLADATGAKVLDYEDLIAEASPDLEWPVFDEMTGSFMCYTSGTTGDPKGVLYTHRGLYLHSFNHCMVDTHAIGERDAVLPIVPMFHANAWGLPFSCAMVGSKQVFPGPAPTPADIAKLMQDEKVTFSAGVPTVWLGMLDVADDYDLSSMKRLVCGGSAVPRSLIERYQERFGITIQQGYGMTETGPLVTMCHIKSDLADNLDDEALLDIKGRQGILVPGVEMRLEDDEGNEVPWDGESMGELCYRGNFIAADYYHDDRAKQTFRNGWLHTGDVATIDPDGYVQITDRTKDLVKSGGEWISSVDLETKIMGHPKVLEAAVIGVAHEKWQERPVACVVVKSGEDLSEQEVLEFLEPQIAKWWMPDKVIFVDEVPKTSVGKFDKKVLRAKHGDVLA